MTKKLRCAIYTRVCTTKKSEHNACQTQEEKIKAFIESQDTMQYYKTYEDAGFPGSNTERPALRKMLHDLTRGKIDVVITHKIDRLTRSAKDFYGLLEIFEKHKVAFISVMEKLDTSTETGRMLRSMMRSFYGEKIKRR